MKKKLLSIFLCIIMSVGMLSGCNSKDAANGNAVNVKVTKKLEEQYIERMEAYEEYYKQVKTEYSAYDNGGTITLDADGLPIFWLYIGDMSSDGQGITQLVSYKDGKIQILAECGEALIPFRGNSLVMACGWDSDNTYLYDEKKKDFVIVTEDLEYDRYASEDAYTDKELSEKAAQLTKMLECVNSFRTMKVVINRSEKKVAYAGNISPDMEYQAFCLLGVITGDGEGRLTISKKYKDSKVAQNYFNQLPDAESSEKSDKVTKTSPGSIYTSPDGTVFTSEDSMKYINCYEVFRKDGDWSESHETGEYFSELELERAIRGLQKNPVHTQGELYLYLASVGYNCEIVDVDLKDYILSKASDSYIANLLGYYFKGHGFNDNKQYFTDLLVNHRSEVLNTEPYKTMINGDGIQDLSYSENVLTVTCSFGIKYKFEIGFTKEGDRINKITYIK